jgi:hypothetical protein
MKEKAADVEKHFERHSLLLLPILLCKNVDGEIEFECSEQTRKEIKDFVAENIPEMTVSMGMLLPKAKEESSKNPFVSAILDFLFNNFEDEIKLVFHLPHMTMRIIGNIPNFNSLKKAWDQC